MDIIETMKVLSDESRLRIYNILRHKRVCVCELESILMLNQANVSKHLSKMRQEGIVSREKEAQWIHYEISEGFLKEESLLVEYLDQKLSNYPVMISDLQVMERYSCSIFTCTDIKQTPDKVNKVIHK